MSIIKKTGSITALLACLSYGSVNSVHAAQLDFQDPFKGDTTAQPAAVDSELCEEEPAPKPELNSQSLGPNLIASAVASDTPLGLQGGTLVAQAPICDLGGVAPEGGASLGSAFPILPLLGGLAAAGGTAALIATAGGDDDDPVPVVPEPAELATASLFASLGVAGVLLRRKKKSNDDM
jgi:hypothetical protein